MKSFSLVSVILMTTLPFTYKIDRPTDRPIKMANLDGAFTQTEPSDFSTSFTKDSRETQVVPGLESISYTASTSLDEYQVIYQITKVSTSTNPELQLIAGYGDMSMVPQAPQMMTVIDQAMAAKSKGHNIVAAFNADFYNMSNGVPSGLLIQDGRVIYNGYQNSDPEENFFGKYIEDDGSIEYKFGLLAELDLSNTKLKEAVGVGTPLVANGEVVRGQFKNDFYYPRMAVGISEDNDLIFLSCDGRFAPYSRGLNFEEMATLFIRAGAVTAYNLDGGGSTSLVFNLGGEFEMLNRTSDGRPRSVSSSLMISSAKAYDPVYAHTHDYEIHSNKLICHICSKEKTGLITGYYYDPLKECKVYLYNGEIQKGEYRILYGDYCFDEGGFPFSGSKTYANGLNRTYKDGVLVSGSTGLIKEERGTRYYINGVLQSGFFQLGKDYYFFDYSGYLYAGKIKLDDTSYVFSEKEEFYGKLLYDKFLLSNQKLYYFYTYSSILTGAQVVNNISVMFNSSGVLQYAEAPTRRFYYAIYQAYNTNYKENYKTFSASYKANTLDMTNIPKFTHTIDGFEKEQSVISNISAGKEMVFVDIENKTVFSKASTLSLFSKKSFYTIHSDEAEALCNFMNKLDKIEPIEMNLKSYATLKELVNELSSLKTLRDSARDELNLRIKSKITQYENYVSKINLDGIFLN